MLSDNERAMACWDWERNEGIDPFKLKAQSNKKFWFNCDMCPHSFIKKLEHIARGSWCPFCANKKLCDDECIVCFNKSFASQSKSSCWSPNNKKSARQTFVSSGIKVLFICDQCGHEFLKSPDGVSRERTEWCSFCASKQLCFDDNYNRCFKKSFASHEKAVFWAKENSKKARETFISSSKQVLFSCSCGHLFKKCPDAIVQGKWCPYCAGQKLCPGEDCQVCFKKSFASHEKAVFWAKENKENPRNVFKKIKSKFLFDCEKGHSFKSALSNISKGQWCPICKKKGEKKLYEFLVAHFDIAREKTFSWCVNKETGKPLRFDFLIKKTSPNPKGYRTLIELDGAQHFQQVRNWAPPDETQQRDLYKMRKANKYCYQVVRITWDMVYNDRGNWKEKLLQAIEEVEWHSCAFVCMNGEYDVYEGRV